jgi:hypothetical protein
MTRGTLRAALSKPLRMTVLGAVALSAATLSADEEPILGPPPAPASALPAPAGPVLSLPAALPPQPGLPQIDSAQPGAPAPGDPSMRMISTPPLPMTPVPTAPFPTAPTNSSAPPLIPLLPVPQAPGSPPGTNPTGVNPTAPAMPFPGPGPGPVFGPGPGGSAFPDSPVLNPDGTPLPDSPTPVPDGAGPPPNPGPPRLRMSDEKEKSPEPGKDAKVAEEALKPIPASLVYRTRDIVRPDLLRGKYYRLAEYTPLVDYNFRFEIETPWGTIPAHGMAMLDVRLRELCALEYASRIADKNPMFSEGFAEAICHTPQGAYILATDPIGSVKRTAQALKRWALAKKMPGGCKANCEPRRRLACLVGCDPETRNEPLSCLLDEMSINAGGGWLTVEVGLNFGLPGLGYLPANAEFKKMMEHRSTLEIQADLDRDLIDLGVPEASRTRFFASQSYTTTQRMAFVYYLKMLIGIENLASLVDGAADTHNECEALASIRELQLIVDLRHTQPLVRAIFIGVPVLTLDDGSQIIITAADYLVDTPRTVQMIAAYRSSFTAVPTKLATLGRVSAGAQLQFKAAGIEVLRHKLGQPEATSHKESTRTAAAGGSAAQSGVPSSTSAASPSLSPARS